MCHALLPTTPWLGHRRSYLASLHDPSDEPLAHAEFSFDFERITLTKHALRELLTDEMLCFHPDIARDQPAASAAFDGDAPMQDA